jgi:hypothetical protein
MDIRRIAIFVLGTLGVGVLSLMAYMMYHSGTRAEAAAWFATGCLALREIVSKIENVAMGVTVGGGEGP